MGLGLTMMGRAGLLLGWLAVVAAGCDADRPEPLPTMDSGPTDVGMQPDAGVVADAGHMDTGSVDMGVDSGRPDVGPPGPCTDVPFADHVIDVDPAGPDTQIHVNPTFDGDAIWAAYSMPSDDGSNGFDTWATRIACNGAHWVRPFRVTTSTGGNDIDPSIAVSGDTVMIAWQRDTGTGVDNLVTLTRRFARDGTPLDAEEQIYRPLRKGAVVTGNIWMPVVTPRASGGFFIAGAWAHSDAQAFQVFLQRLTEAGSPDGEAFDVFPSPTTSQTAVSIVAEPDDDLWIAWDRSVGNESRVVYTQVAATATTADLDQPVMPHGVDSSGAYLALDQAGEAWLAMGVLRGPGFDVFVTPTDLLSPGESFWSGGTNTNEYAPGLSFSSPGRGVLTHYRQIRGFQNDVLVRRFTADPMNQTVTTLVPVDGGPAPPYGPAIVHVEGDRHFIAWQEGDNPDFRIRAQFLDASRL